MNIQFNKVSNVSGELTINMEKADYQPKVEKALKNFAQQAQIQSFRIGIVPMSLIKKMYGVQAKAEEVNRLLQESLFDYIKSNQINMLGEPIGSTKQIPQDIEKQDDFTFIFDIALAPEFTAELSANDTVDFYDIEVADEMVTKQLDALRQQAGHPEDVEEYADRDVVRGQLVELNEEGQAKEGGINIETASLMPSFSKELRRHRLSRSAPTLLTKLTKLNWLPC